MPHWIFEQYPISDSYWSNISELIQVTMNVEETTYKVIYIYIYTQGDGSIVLYLLPGIFRLSKNKRLKRDILQNTKIKFQSYVRMNISWRIPLRTFNVIILMSQDDSLLWQRHYHIDENCFLDDPDVISSFYMISNRHKDFLTSGSILLWVKISTICWRCSKAEALTLFWGHRLLVLLPAPLTSSNIKLSKYFISYLRYFSDGS